jgi:CRP-like cAMP-binding protein
MGENRYGRVLEELDKVFKMPEAEADDIEKSFSLLKQKKGDKYVSEGEVPDSIAFVVSGLYKYYYIDRDGNEWVKHFTPENDFVASYAAFILRKPSLYSIEALEDSELLVLKYKDYMDGFEESIYWQNIARKFTERMYIIKELREGSFLKDTAEERYLQFNKDYPEIQKRLKQKDIASYLGIKPETLSRIKSRKN